MGEWSAQNTKHYLSIVSTTTWNDPLPAHQIFVVGTKSQDAPGTKLTNDGNGDKNRKIDKISNAGTNAAAPALSLGVHFNHRSICFVRGVESISKLVPRDQHKAPNETRKPSPSLTLKDRHEARAREHDR